MIAIDFGERTYPLPENWNEVLQSGKYLPLSKIMYRKFESETAARFEILKLLSGIDGYEIGIQLKAATAKARRNASEDLGFYLALQVLEELLPELDFVFKGEPLTVNPLPVIRCGLTRLYGPAEKLSDQTGSEMEECGWAYSEYVKTGDEKYLHRLIAAMYRPKRLLFGKRKPYSKAITDKLESKVAALPVEVKLGILLFYEMCEKWWREQFAFLYGGGDTTKPEEIDSLATSRVIRLLAGGKRGNVEQVRLLTRDEIFFELSELERERKEKQK